MRKLLTFLIALGAIVFAVVAPASANGVLFLAGRAPSAPCSQATAFLARTSGLSGTETTAYTNMICGMVTDGVWAKLDILYIFATNNTTTANLNLVSTSFTGTTLGSPAFSADHGYTASHVVARSTYDARFFCSNVPLQPFASVGDARRRESLSPFKSPRGPGDDLF